MERGLSHRGLGPRGLHSQVGCPRRQRTRPVLWTAGPGTAPASGSRRRALSPGSQEAGPGWSGQPQGRTRRRGGRGRARTGADGGLGRTPGGQRQRGGLGPGWHRGQGADGSAQSEGPEGGICLGVGIGYPLQRVPGGPWGPLVTSDPRPWTALGPREQLRAHQAPGYWDTPAEAGGPVFPGNNLEAFAVRTDTPCLVALCKYCVFPKWKILW